MMENPDHECQAKKEIPVDLVLGGAYRDPGVCVLANWISNVVRVDR
jgi:hypothetical protein